MTTNAVRRRNLRTVTRAMVRRQVRLNGRIVTIGSHQPLSWPCRCRGCRCAAQITTIPVPGSPSTCGPCARGDHRYAYAGRGATAEVAAR